MCPRSAPNAKPPCPPKPGPGDPEPTWHQVAELPPLAAIVTEHQGHARTCPCCGHLNRGEIPPEIRAHVIGPRLAAVMSYFSGRHHIEPTGRRRDRRDRLRGADLLGHGDRVGSRDDCRLGRGLSRGPGRGPGRAGEEHRRDRLEREGARNAGCGRRRPRRRPSS